MPSLKMDMGLPPLVAGKSEIINLKSLKKIFHKAVGPVGEQILNPPRNVEDSLPTLNQSENPEMVKTVEYNLNQHKPKR